MGEGWERVALGTANDRFKAKYQQYLTVALLVSLVVWVNIFLFTPELEFEAYRLKEESITVIDIPDVVDIPPPPQELPKPQVPIEAAPDAEVEDDVEIAETMPDDFSGTFTTPGAGTGPLLELDAHAEVPSAPTIANMATRCSGDRRFACLFTPRRMLPLRSPGKEAQPESGARSRGVCSERNTDRGTPAGKEVQTR